MIGCSLSTRNMVERAEGRSKVVATQYFKHFVGFNKRFQKDSTVVVFVEGDGTPWQTARQIAIDPSPRSPLLLNWFLTADIPAVYLGRPCYFAVDDDQCSAYWYTHGRYSKRVVVSMVDALQQQLPAESLILVGHSGGGTLAMLMAERMDNVSMVVTIAGNLNVAAWAEYHQYSPLIGSLDPTIDLMFERPVYQVHYYSLYDEVIKADWIKAFAVKQTNVTLVEVPVEDHSAGWSLYQGEIMTLIEQEWMRVQGQRP